MDQIKFQTEKICFPLCNGGSELGKNGAATCFEVIHSKRLQTISDMMKLEKIRNNNMRIEAQLRSIQPKLSYNELFSIKKDKDNAFNETTNPTRVTLTWRSLQKNC